MLAAMLLSGCFPSFEVSSDGGVEAMMDKDVRSERGADGTPSEAAKDAAPHCVPIEVTPWPAHGGPSCAMDGSPCTPGDVTTFSPQWVPPLTGAPYLDVCDSEQVATFLTQCYGPTSTFPACKQWEDDNPPCFDCVISQASDCQYGAQIYEGTPENNAPRFNYGGCIYLAEPCNEPCAEAVLFDTECENTACNLAGGCSTASDDEWLSCVGQSDMACGCTGYHTSQNCIESLLEDPASHPSVALCALAQPMDFPENFTTIVTFMCGPPPK